MFSQVALLPHKLQYYKSPLETGSKSEMTLNGTPCKNGFTAKAKCLKTRTKRKVLFKKAALRVTILTLNFIRF